MLSWDEFDSEDTTPAPAGKPAQAKPAAPVADSPAMGNQAESSVEDARQISADDSDAIARAKSRAEGQERPRGKSWVVDSTTVNVGVIQGGGQSNTIPTHCHMEVDARRWA
mgnify:CR=1 FL=1